MNADNCVLSAGGAIGFALSPISEVRGLVLVVVLVLDLLGFWKRCTNARNLAPLQGASNDLACPRR
jgi:hypothetical protein